MLFCLARTSTYQKLFMIWFSGLIACLLIFQHSLIFLLLLLGPLHFCMGCPEVIISSENCRENSFFGRKQRRPAVNFSERREWIYEFKEALPPFLRQQHHIFIHLVCFISNAVKNWLVYEFWTFHSRCLFLLLSIFENSDSRCLFTVCFRISFTFIWIKLLTFMVWLHLHNKYDVRFSIIV